MDSIEQKAKELIDKFKGFEYDDGTSIVIHRIHYKAAKKCAIICVDEKITTMNHVKELYGMALKTVWNNDEMVDAFRYWCDNSISDLEQVKERLLAKQ